jgi:hypothetical protein
LKDQARAGEPQVFQVDTKVSEELKASLLNFFRTGFTDDFGMSLSQAEQDQLSKDIDGILFHGIMSDQALAGLPDGKPVRVIAPDETFYEYSEPYNALRSAEKLTGLLNLPPHIAGLVVKDIEKILTPGNLIFDQSATETAAETAASMVQPVIKERKRGELLIERHQPITRETVDMFEAEKRALPNSYGLVLLGNQLILSCLLLMLALFFLYRVYPKIFKTGFTKYISLAIYTQTIRTIKKEKIRISLKHVGSTPKKDITNNEK